MVDIQEFWEYKKNNDLTLNQLKSLAREYFTEDFIENLKKWKENLLDINILMKDNVTNYVTNIKQWEDMSFDYFCININNLIEEWIIEKHDIKPIDIKDITAKLINNYIKSQLISLYDKRYTISNLMESIKIPIIDSIL